MATKTMRATLNAAAKTVTFTDVPSGELKLERIRAVIDVTKSTVLYRPDQAAKTGTVATNVLTLAFDTTTGGYANGDAIMALYDVPDAVVEHVSTSETLVANTVPNSGNGRTLTPAGFVATEVEISNIDGAAIIYGTIDGSAPSSTNFLFVLPATPCNVVLPVDGAVTVRLKSPGTPLVGYVIRGN